MLYEPDGFLHSSSVFLDSCLRCRSGMDGRLGLYPFPLRIKQAGDQQDGQDEHDQIGQGGNAAHKSNSKKNAAYRKGYKPDRRSLPGENQQNQHGDGGDVVHEEATQQLERWGVHIEHIQREQADEENDPDGG